MYIHSKVREEIYEFKLRLRILTTHDNIHYTAMAYFSIVQVIS